MKPLNTNITNKAAQKLPRLFHWDAGLEMWSIVSEELVEKLKDCQILDLREIPKGGIIEIKFRRMDMSDKEIAALPDS